MNRIGQPQRRTRRKIVGLDQCIEFAAHVDPGEFERRGGTAAGFADWLFWRRRTVADGSQQYLLGVYVNLLTARRRHGGDLDAESRQTSKATSRIRRGPEQDSAVSRGAGSQSCFRSAAGLPSRSRRRMAPPMASRPAILNADPAGSGTAAGGRMASSSACAHGAVRGGFG